MKEGRCKALSLTFLVIVILLLVLFGSNNMSAYSYEDDWESMERSVAELPQMDSPLSLLGKSFTNIKDVMGEPDDEGYSNWYGTHYYLSYTHKNGTIHFCSPTHTKNKVAILIILEAGQEVLDVQVGMPFQDIKSALGEPDSGPVLGMNNEYFIDYYFGQIKDGVPEVLLSFSAKEPESPTYKAFIKWEAFYEYEG
jgi:hypothetical protein